MIGIFIKRQDESSLKARPIRNFCRQRGEDDDDFHFGENGSKFHQSPKTAPPLKQ